MILSSPQVMSEEFADVTEPDNGQMEGLLFDLGIFGDYPAALGGPRSRSGLPVERPSSTGQTTYAVCGAVASLSVSRPTGLLSHSFGYNPNRELSEKSDRHVQGESRPTAFVIYSIFYCLCCC